MAKLSYVMLRVLNEERSIYFYTSAFGLVVSERLAFDGFTLIYLRGADSDFEIELTVNHGRTEPYPLGEGYGHLAMVVEDIDATHRHVRERGLEPTEVKAFHRDGALFARFFFVRDPDGYKIEVVQKGGRYQ